MTFTEIKEQEQSWILHTYGRVDAALVRGENARAWDAQGKEYIDFTSGIGVNSLGYSDPAWAAAVARQAGTIQHLCNYYYSPENTALAEELCRAAGMAQAFFCNSGAEANECAVKVARKYGEADGRHEILTLVNSFHGRTLTTLAATGQEGFHRDFQPLTPGFVYTPANDLPALEKILSEHPGLCAVLLETVQGEGGVVPLEAEFLRQLETLCRRRDLLLMIDEVQTGVGRTGSFYSYQSFGVSPDVVTSAKGLAGGLPIGVCLVAERLRNILKPGQQGSTFGGNPVVCAGAREVVRRVNDAKFLRAVSEKGDYIRQRLGGLPQVEAIRGRGLMLGIRLTEGLDAHQVLLDCAASGLLILTAKELVRFLPPLTIPFKDLEEGCAIFARVLESAQAAK